MKTQIKKILILGSSLLMLSLLTGCDFTDYKTRIQRENDINNPTGNKSVCLAVGDLTEDMYPYTIKYMPGYHKDLHYRDPIYVNHKLNKRLALYAKEGLFTEELVGHDGDKPLYRYDLTEEGRKYVDWWGGTNFCFGRVVVEKVTGVDDQLQGQRVIIFTYHLENVPNWIKNKDIYSLYKGYGGLKEGVTGQIIEGGAHYYSISYDGTLRLKIGLSGAYVL
ncbi:hypothetical protein A9G34_05805 [Gilliamella sp. Choc4-2]|uniref:hypothetical protein n=1 Tax=unclassified Gilliamella TaxID=2685620 RepID=UPI00080DEDC5|nr:hypothetical protein [Gilliamella apicola]OCG46014.1 hypothetical protein A9G34_05805 [Gilliamella apicola]OCG61845.1 hypothetical protein A9G48_09675 [Gilliamella apicola]